MKRRHDMNDMNINSIVAEFADKPETEVPKQATASPAPTAKVAHKPTQKPDMVKKPVQKPEKETKNIGEALKWAAVFGGLFALIAYWRYTGQMADSAAVPSLCATAALFGYGIGRNTRA
jgi:hypothetical protein